MSNELENQIDSDLAKDKYRNIYLKHKFKILLFSIFLILAPICFQTYFFIDKKKNEKQIVDLLKAEILINKQPDEAIKILNNLQYNGNETIKILASGRLLEYYLNLNNDLEVKKEINKIEFDFKNPIFSELNFIKKTLLNFENISEKDILNFLELRKENLSQVNFRLIKTKLLYDFYIKNNQINKAKEVLNIIK